MAWILTALSRFHISAAMVLATIAFLAVPENAFADEMQTCADKCKTDYAAGSAAYYQCIADCCLAKDPEDPDCCSTYCAQDEYYSTCVTECIRDQCMAGNPTCRLNGNEQACKMYTDCKVTNCKCKWDSECKCMPQ